jgi:hypothetical protein
MCGHGVLLSSQTRAKFIETHSATSVTVSVTRDFSMTWYLGLWSQAFLFFERVHNNECS